jgi:hypothetical protein
MNNVTSNCQLKYATKKYFWFYIIIASVFYVGIALLSRTISVYGSVDFSLIRHVTFLNILLSKRVTGPKVYIAEMVCNHFRVLTV